MLKTSRIIDFQPISKEDRELYDKFLKNGEKRGCEYSFPNLYLWGDIKIATVHGHIVMLGRFGDHYLYYFPLGDGNKRAVLDSIIEDSEARGIPCRISGILEEEVAEMEALYPGVFDFQAKDSTFDYIYLSEDLAELTGKKYHAKRNHINKFTELHPNYKIEPIDENNLTRVAQMVEEWYAERIRKNPEEDFALERIAIKKALADSRELCMEGIILTDGDEVLAMTLGNRMYADTFDVNFEKARADVDGAYPMVNREFVRYITKKYPSVKYIDREEDMGVEGLRKAKKSYHPYMQFKKYRAYKK